MKKIIIIVCIVVWTNNGFCQDAVYYILKARALTASGQSGQAIKILTEAVDGKRDFRLYTERAEANIKNGNYSAALSDLNEANKLMPSSGEYGLSKVYALKGDAATSMYHLEMNLSSAFKKGEKEIMLDPAFGSVESKPEWRQLWKKEWYNKTEKAISEIEYYISAGKIDESKAVFADLKKDNESSDDIIYAEALINLASGKYSEVVKTISGLSASDPGNEKYLRILARAQTGASNPSGASVTYSQLLSSGVADAELLLLRAECYRKTGETDKALADIKKYLEFYPENKTAISLAGKTEAVMGDNLTAIEYFSNNLKLHPNDPQCYIDRGNSYFISKSWNWAIKDYSMSLDLKPANSEVWLNKGISLLNIGDVEDACHDFKESLRLGNKRASEYISGNCIK